jgi:hypothetical protein
MTKAKSIVGGWMWYVETVKQLSGKQVVYKELMKQYNTGKTPEEAIKVQGVLQ